jgi:hypothetical protein
MYSISATLVSAEQAPAAFNRMDTQARHSAYLARAHAALKPRYTKPAEPVVRPWSFKQGCEGRLRVGVSPKFRFGPTSQAHREEAGANPDLGPDNANLPHISARQADARPNP